MNCKNCGEWLCIDTDESGIINTGLCLKCDIAASVDLKAEHRKRKECCSCCKYFRPYEEDDSGQGWCYNTGLPWRDPNWYCFDFEENP